MNQHLSEEQISDWIAQGRIEGDGSREVAEHLHGCPRCAALLNEAIAETQNAILLFRDSYRQMQPVTFASHRLRWVPSAVAIAAAIVAAVTLYRPSRPVPTPPQEVFLTIPYVIPPAPYERTEVVHMDVSVAALIQAGFTLNAPAADSVAADVLIGQDGRPLAVAFPETKQ